MCVGVFAVFVCATMVEFDRVFVFVFVFVFSGGGGMSGMGEIESRVGGSTGRGDRGGTGAARERGGAEGGKEREEATATEAAEDAEVEAKGARE